MKKQITLLSLLISSLTALAQPTLTHGGTAPLTGITITSHTGSYLSQGNSGANQTWNFGSYSGTTASSFDVVTPASTPFASSYPTANSCNYSSAGSSYEYFEDISTATYLVGAESPSASLDFSPNKETVFIYPLSYNGTWTDAYQVNGTVSSVPFTRSGSVTATADGWGTLITPNGTYTNALRIHLSQTYTDVVLATTYLGSQDIYEWYKEGIHYPIFLTSTSVYDGNPGPSTTYYNDAPSGIKEQTEAESVIVYPTPANGELFVKIGNNNSAFRNYEMTDLTGRKILTGKISHQLNTINVQDIPAGHYLLRIFSDEAVLTRKVLIQ